MIYSFGDFELDTRLYELRREGASCRVEPQVFDVLRYLIQNRDRVISKDELFEKIWGDRIVSESALSSRLKAARQAIGDSGREQRLIKTLHGRGFRFVGEVTERSSNGGLATPSSPSTELELEPILSSDIQAVGREGELRKLERHLEAARGGSRQLVLITGEAGLGKTTLVEKFLRGLEEQNSTRILAGQCLDQRGQGEAYLPLLEALGRAGRQPGGAAVVELLKRRAPSWLIEMPWLVESDELAGLRLEARGMTRDRMLRELVEAFEELTRETPMVLVLEDLHWSDPSTVDLLARLASRQEPARLLVIGTYRPAEARAGEHPLGPVVERLKLRRLAVELPLSFLDEEAVRQYLEGCLPGADLPDRLASLLHQRTDGNPLFMGSVVDHWIAQSAFEPAGGSWRITADLEELCVGVPESLRLLIERRLADLPTQVLRILEAASVQGPEFSAVAVAAGAGTGEEEVEECLARLAREGRVIEERDTVSWHDGSVSASFGFIHDLIQEVIYDRVPAGRRARLHSQIGSRLETGYGPTARDRAAELAVHFVAGRNLPKALEYLRLAAHQALRRLAHLEGIDHLNKGLELIPALADERSRAELELDFQAALAPALIAKEGLGSRRAEAAYIRARELAEELDDQQQLSAMIYGLAIQNELRGNFRVSQELIERRLGLETRPQEAAPLEAENSDLLACSHFHQGNYREALRIAEAGMQAFDRLRHSPIASGYGENPAISCHSWAGLNLWFLGYPDRALERARRALALSEEPGQVYSLSNSTTQLACLHQFRQEPPEVLRWAEKTIEIAQQQGFILRAAMGRLLKGWALSIEGETDEGLTLLRDGLQRLAELGAGMDRPYFLGLAAEAHGKAEATDRAIASIDEALGLIDASRSHFYEAELHRLRGELLLSADPDGSEDASEACLQRALELARRQEARSIELRAATSMAALWQQQDRAGEARELLARVYGSFDEGFASPDLVRAKARLDAL